MWTQIIFVICQCCTLFIRKISDYDRAGFRAFQVFVPIEPFSPNIRLDTTNSMDCKIEKSGSRKQAFHFHFVPLRFGKKKHKLHSPGAEPNFNIACFECRVKCFLQCKQIYVYVQCTHTQEHFKTILCHSLALALPLRLCVQTIFRFYDGSTNVMLYDIL